MGNNEPAVDQSDLRICASYGSWSKYRYTARGTVHVHVAAIMRMRNTYTAYRYTVPRYLHTGTTYIHTDGYRDCRDCEWVTFN